MIRVFNRMLRTQNQKLEKEVQPKTRERSRSRDQQPEDICSSLFLVVSNLPNEAKEDDIRKFMQTVKIEVSQTSKSFYRISLFKMTQRCSKFKVLKMLEKQ